MKLLPATVPSANNVIFQVLVPELMASVLPVPVALTVSTQIGTAVRMEVVLISVSAVTAKPR